MQTIDLPTGQQVKIEYELASLAERLLAMLIDLMVVVGGGLVSRFIIETAFDLESSWEIRGIMSFLLLATFVLYNFFFELLSHGQSLGKRALGIQVVRLDGEEPTPGDYLLRAVLHFVDTFITAGIVGGLLIGSTPRRQRIGDMAAGTSVIRMRASERFRLEDILSISSLEDYEPRYPAVRQFSESDMLLIKHAIARSLRYRNPAHRSLLQDLASKVAQHLGLSKVPDTPEEFLKTLIRDYIVLTR
ncbi:MAG: RDD family protein [Bacteroidetes bacterium]|nr:MAG: RDD family protein [Bacteroidota bacterium]